MKIKPKIKPKITSKIETQLNKPARKATPAISTAQRTHNNCGQMRRLKAAFSNSEEATKVGPNVGQNGGGFPPSPQLTGVFNFQNFQAFPFSDFLETSSQKTIVWQCNLV